MKNFLQIILTTILILSTPAIVKANEVTFSASVDSSQIILGESLKLTLSITGKKDVNPFNLPPLEGFEIRYMGPSTKVSIINGSYSSVKSFIYSVFPKQAGKFVIPGFTLTINGESYTSNPIPIEVINKGGTAGKALTIEEKLYAELRIDKKDIYVNERVPITVFLYVNELSFQDIQYPQLENIGIKIDGYASPRQYQKIINGRKFDVVEFKTSIYPTRAGELTLGPAKVPGNLMINKGKSRRGRRNMFDDDFFDSFFNRFERKPMELVSNTLQLNVKPLPDKNKKDSFSGAVGQFKFNVTAGPLTLKEGDPITLKMDISGNGNLSAIKFPVLDNFDQFKLYDPQVNEKKGVKYYEQVIIPKNSDIKEIPPITFTYFDSNDGKYKDIKSDPIKINVEEVKDSEKFTIVGANLSSNEGNITEEVLGSDIVYIKEKIGKLYLSDKRRVNVGFVFIWIVVVFLVWGVLFFNFKRTHRLKTDNIYAKKMRAPKQAKKEIDKAREYLKKNDVEHFYNSVFKTLQGYLGDKLHLGGGNISKESVGSKLGKIRGREKVVDVVGHLLDECDQVRYASTQISTENMATSLNKLEKLIDFLERSLK